MAPKRGTDEHETSLEPRRGQSAPKQVDASAEAPVHPPSKRRRKRDEPSSTSANNTPPTETSANSQPKKAAKAEAERQRDSREAKKKIKPMERLSIEYDPPARRDEESATVAADRRFITALRLNPGVTPLVTSDVILEELSKRSPQNKIDIVIGLPDFVLYPPQWDAVMGKNENELLRALRTDFSLVRVEQRSAGELTRTFMWTFQKQYDAMPRSAEPVYQGRDVDAEGNRTSMGSSEFHEAFLGTPEEQERYRGANFHDVTNYSGHLYFPAAIRDVSLVHRLHLKTNKDPWDRINEGVREPNQDWNICTKYEATSGWHIDYAGYCTAVVGVIGRKIWFTPRGERESLRRQMRMKSSREANWAKGVSVTEIGPGDCLIMSPGTIHAVYTPEDCMVAGCFFWTVETFARSVQCIRLALKALSEAGRVKDDMGVQQYHLLTYVFENMGVEEVWTKDALADVWTELGRLLHQERKINWNSDTMKAVRRMKSKERKQVGFNTNFTPEEVEVIDARNLFYWASVEWWWAEYRRQDARSSAMQKRDKEHEDQEEQRRHTGGDRRSHEEPVQGEVEEAGPESETPSSDREDRDAEPSDSASENDSGDGDGDDSDGEYTPH